ncbi:MAG: endo alpha-1,4 polygalactosaminidase [Ketobacter sp.]
MNEFLLGLLSLIMMYAGSSTTTNTAEDQSTTDTEQRDPVPPEEDTSVEEDTVTATWYRPPVLATWQWQLSGDINTEYEVDIYDIDLFDTSPGLIQQIKSSGKKVICYFSAGSYEDWRPDATQFADADLGRPLDGWPGERWLDIRSDKVLTIMKNRLDIAKQKGCDGVEPDNVDGYSNRTGINFTAQDQLKYNKSLAKLAHARGLAIGLKNNLDQVAALVNHFDYAVNEQCFEYNECELLSPFIAQNKPVFNAEYQNRYVNNEAKRNALCTQSIDMQFSTLILPLNLDDKFRYSCL